MFANYNKALSQGTINMVNQNLNNQNQVKRRTRMPFTKEEDQLLLQLVQYFGINDKNNWYFIASRINGRSPRQCRERYQLFLSDDVRKKAKWTKEEDELLISKYNIYGPHWKQMEQFFVGRTSYNIKNRFISLSRRNKFTNENEEIQNQKSNETNTKVEKEIAPNSNPTFNNEYSSVLNESDFDFDFDLDLFPLVNGIEQFAMFE
ncbi:hypothetical protein M9Y10_022316 [Tritrichomonas musculus]|uniref:Myb-like DNA-binding domain containing protein n=1 Tax=Tritrichomonas musculus TaxID=1915356 RepID=A0ABR2KRX9_9EUKA